jgi:hypothetical protein
LTSDLIEKPSEPYAKTRYKPVSFFNKNDISRTESQTISETSSKKTIADLGGKARFTNAIDLGPLNEYYKEGLGSERRAKSP